MILCCQWETIIKMCQDSSFPTHESNDTNSRLCEAETNDKPEWPHVRDQTNTRQFQTCRFVLQNRETLTESHICNLCQVLRVYFETRSVIIIMQDFLLLFIHICILFGCKSDMVIGHWRHLRLGSQVIMIIISACKYEGEERWERGRGRRRSSNVLFTLVTSRQSSHLSIKELMTSSC